MSLDNLDADSPRSFYFLRHGETDWNLENRFQGHQDIPLNETGRKQARRAAILLAQKPIDAVYSSHLSRAQETANIVAAQMDRPPDVVSTRAISECESEITARLIYNGLGRSHYPSFSGTTSTDETPESFLARNREALSAIIAGKSLQRPLIVAHGGTYWALCQILNVKPNDIPNCIPVQFKKVQRTWTQFFQWHD